MLFFLDFRVSLLWVTFLESTIDHYFLGQIKEVALLGHSMHFVKVLDALCFLEEIVLMSLPGQGGKCCLHILALLSGPEDGFVSRESLFSLCWPQWHRWRPPSLSSRGAFGLSCPLISSWLLEACALPATSFWGRDQSPASPELEWKLRGLGALVCPLRCSAVSCGLRVLRPPPALLTTSFNCRGSCRTRPAVPEKGVLRKSYFFLN